MSFDIIDVLVGFDSAECQMRVSLSPFQNPTGNNKYTMYYVLYMYLAEPH